MKTTPLTAGHSNSPCNGNILTPLERRFYHQTIEQISPLTLLEAWWPAEQGQSKRMTLAPLARARECICASLCPLGPGNLVCAHGTILTNRESSELVGVRIFYALKVRTRTICDCLRENPAYGIRALFAQYAFLVAQVEICQSPDFVIYMSNNPSCRLL